MDRGEGANGVVGVHSVTSSLKDVHKESMEAVIKKGILFIQLIANNRLYSRSPIFIQFLDCVFQIMT